MAGPQIKTLDALAKKACYAKYGYTCIIKMADTNCSGDMIDVHHWINKRRGPSAHRWDLRNIAPICRGHHTLIHANSEYRGRITIGAIGQELYDDLVRLSHSKFDKTFIQVREELNAIARHAPPERYASGEISIGIMFI